MSFAVCLCVCFRLQKTYCLCKSVLKVWNSLPPTIVNFSSLAAFRNPLEILVFLAVFMYPPNVLIVILRFHTRPYNCHFIFHRIVLSCVTV